MAADLRAPSAGAWPWPPALDALSAAPRHHRLLLENDRVRVLEARIPPGDVVPVHTHCWPSVLYILSWSDFVRRDSSGAVVVDSRAGGAAGSPPSVLWSEAVPPHSLENVGTAEHLVISVEIKPVAA
jgi:hypothetical protein